MQKVLQKKAKALLPGGEPRARLRSSPAKLSSSPSTVWQARHHGDARAPGCYRRPWDTGSFLWGAPHCPEPAVPARPRTVLLRGAASQPLSRARQLLRVCQPSLWPCSPSSRRNKGQILSSDTFADVAPEPPGAF